MRMVDAEYKLEKNIKIAMLYLEDDDAVNAETFIKKAASLITNTKVRTQLCNPCNSSAASRRAEVHSAFPLAQCIVHHASLFLWPTIHA